MKSHVSNRLVCATAALVENGVVSLKIPAPHDTLTKSLGMLLEPFWNPLNPPEALKKLQEATVKSPKTSMISFSGPLKSADTPRNPTETSLESPETL